MTLKANFNSIQFKFTKVLHVFDTNYRLFHIPIIVMSSQILLPLILALYKDQCISSCKAPFIHVLTRVTFIRIRIRIKHIHTYSY